MNPALASDILEEYDFSRGQRGKYAERYAKMPVNIEEIIERAFEKAFAKALEQTLQSKAELLFQKMFTNGSPFSKRLEEKIEHGLEKFMDEGIRWDKKRPGFKK